MRLRYRILLPVGLACLLGTALSLPAQEIAAWLEVSAESPAPGERIEVEVVVDLSATGEKLGAYEARLEWDPEVLELVEVEDGDTPAFSGPQTRSGSGELVFSQFSTGGAGGEVSLLKAVFEVVGRAGQSTSLELSFSVLDAAGTFADLLPQVQVRPVTLTVEEPISPGGTNAGFTVSLDPTSVTGARTGQTIDLVLSVQGAVQAKGALVTARYDPAIFTFKGFTPDDLIPGLLSLPGTPVTGADGLNTIQEGGSQLEGTPASGEGTLGTMTFEVSGRIPDDGAFISIVEVQLNASSQDRSVLRFAEGEFGVEFIPQAGISGDFNRDGRVDFDDFFLFADQFGTTPDSMNWDPVYSLDGDGDVDFEDFFLFADNFGKQEK